MRIKGIAATGVITLALLINSMGTASAQNRDFKTALEECFWGLILTDEDQRGLSLGLNVVSGALGSYAYTSATLSPDTFCVEKTAKTAQFVNESYERLAQDITRRDGEFLKAAMTLTGCSTDSSISAVSADMRKGLTQDLMHTNYNQMEQAEKAVRLYTNLLISADKHCEA